MAIILKPENVAQLVFLIRGEKVMLDAHLAMVSPFCEGIRELEITDCDVRREERSHHLPFEITICDLKTRPRRSTLSSLRFHRTGRCYAFQCSTQLSRGRSQHRHHANVCAAAPAYGQQRRSPTQDREFGKEI